MRPGSHKLFSCQDPSLGQFIYLMVYCKKILCICEFIFYLDMSEEMLSWHGELKQKATSNPEGWIPTGSFRAGAFGQTRLVISLQPHFTWCQMSHDECISLWNVIISFNSEVVKFVIRACNLAPGSVRRCVASVILLADRLRVLCCTAAC